MTWTTEEQVFEDELVTRIKKNENVNGQFLLLPMELRAFIVSFNKQKEDKIEFTE